MHKQTEGDDKPKETRVAAETRKSTRIRTETSILKKRKGPREPKDGEAKKKRPRTNKNVSFGGSLANPEFQGILNTAAQQDNVD